MAISFYLQSKKNPAPIYVRIREGVSIDAKAKANFSINPDRFDGGSVKQLKDPRGATAELKKVVAKENEGLISLQKKLDALKNKLSTLLNEKKDFEQINSDWLKDIINPKNEKIAH